MLSPLLIFSFLFLWDTPVTYASWNEEENGPPLLRSRLNNSSSMSSWSFLVVADWHNAEEFATNPGPNSAHYQAKLQQIQYLHENYKGELVVLPGDSNRGKWHLEVFAKKFRPELTTKERIVEAGRNCYGTMKEVWARGGYDTLLMATGDHELGDNPWYAQKVHLLPEFRQGFQEKFNLDPATGEFKFDKQIGSEPSRPIGTEFQETSFAHKHKNVLFITIDAFKTRSTAGFDRETGVGSNGAVTGTVDGLHLQWFKNVLREARKDSSISHIIVQSHIPILYPVRKYRSSGMMADYEEDNEFWKAMVEYNVDIYLAGEVHSNTVTKDNNSSLLQVVSRGNHLTQFVKVDVTDSALTFTSYKEKSKSYEQHGSLLVKKSISGTTIQSNGVLELLDREAALLHLTFDEILPRNSPQEMRGKMCEEYLPNHGVFGQEYAPDIANVKLLDSGINGGKFGQFDERFESRAGIESLGPNGAGYTISFSLWIKTNRKEEMILVHSGEFRKFGSFNLDMFTLTLKNGLPTLYLSPHKHLRPIDPYQLSNGKWHHIAVSMPKNNCLLSEVNMFVDGEVVPTEIPKGDQFIYMHSGQVSIGGFGYSTPQNEEWFPSFKPYSGGMDEFYMWGKPLIDDDLQLSMERN